MKLTRAERRFSLCAKSAIAIGTCPNTWSVRVRPLLAWRESIVGSGRSARARPLAPHREPASVYEERLPRGARGKPRREAERLARRAPPRDTGRVLP